MISLTTWISICAVSKIAEYYVSRRLFRGYWINKYPQMYRNKPMTDKGMAFISTFMSLPIPLFGALVSFADTGYKCWLREKKQVIQLSFQHSRHKPADLIIFPRELRKENRAKYSEFWSSDDFQIPHTPRITKALKGDFLPTKRA